MTRSPAGEPSAVQKYTLLTTLYLSQGLPFGFFTQAVPAILRKRGVSLPAIGLTSLLALPWAIKFLWASWVDARYSERLGRRRSWIIPLQWLTALIIFLLAWVDQAHAIPWLLAASLITNLLAATQDIATDGLATELLAPDQRGLGNGIQVAGYRAGMIIGGGALLYIFDLSGWFVTFMAMALTLLIASVPIVRLREPRFPPESIVAPGAAIKSFIGQPRMAIWLVALVAYKSGDALASTMIRPMLIDLGYSLGDLGWMLGGVGFAASLLGAVAGGALITRLGRRRALLGFGLAQAIAAASYAMLAWVDASTSMVCLTVTADHGAGGMATAVLFTLMMDACREESAGLDYTVQASVVVIATGVAGSVSGFIAAKIGYGPHYLVSGGATLVGLFFVWRQLNRRALPHRVLKAIK